MWPADTMYLCVVGCVTEVWVIAAAALLLAASVHHMKVGRGRKEGM